MFTVKEIMGFGEDWYVLLTIIYKCVLGTTVSMVNTCLNVKVIFTIPDIIGFKNYNMKDIWILNHTVRHWFW